MNFVLNTDPSTLSPIALFLQADLVVKAVMVALLLASIWTWAVILGFTFRIGRIRKRGDRFERAFWDATDIDAFYRSEGAADLPVHPIALDAFSLAPRPANTPADGTATYQNNRSAPSRTPGDGSSVRQPPAPFGTMHATLPEYATRSDHTGKPATTAAQILPNYPEPA